MTIESSQELHLSQFVGLGQMKLLSRPQNGKTGKVSDLSDGPSKISVLFPDRLMLISIQVHHSFPLRPIHLPPLWACFTLVNMRIVSLSPPSSPDDPRMSSACSRQRVNFDYVLDLFRRQKVLTLHPTFRPRDPSSSGRSPADGGIDCG